MEEINKNIFSGFCKIGTNHNLEFDFFCKTHNELCCEKCISKQGEKEFVQHKNCDVCSLESIKEQKEKNYKENIKNLKNISSNFEEILKGLKNIIDNVNEEKDKIKLNIQKSFTKLRNALNKREDELLISIDNIYENINTKEIMSREGEKLLNKSRLLLKIGESPEYNGLNSTKKLSSLINVYLTLENTLKGINSIKEDIDKFIESFQDIGKLKKTDNC